MIDITLKGLTIADAQLVLDTLRHAVAQVAPGYVQGAAQALSEQAAPINAPPPAPEVAPVAMPAAQAAGGAPEQPPVVSPADVVSALQEGMNRAAAARLDAVLIVPAAPAPALATPETDATPVVQEALKRGRGRPRKPVPELIVPAAPVLPVENPRSPSAIPFAIFDEPAAPATEERNDKAATLPPSAAVLTIQQRQLLFGNVYQLQPEGPHKAIALMQRFDVSRITDLKPEQYSEFDNLAARALAGTYDPRNTEAA